MKLLRLVSLLSLLPAFCGSGANAASCDGIAKDYTLVILPNATDDKAFLFRGDSLRFSESFVDPEYLGAGQRYNGTFYGNVISGESKIVVQAGFKVNPLQRRSDDMEDAFILSRLDLSYHDLTERATSSDALLDLLRLAPSAHNLNDMAQMIAGKDKKLVRVPLGIYPFTRTVVVLIPSDKGVPFFTPHTNETLGVALLPFDPNGPYVIALWGEKRVDEGAVPPGTKAPFGTSIEIGEREKAQFRKVVEVTGSTLLYFASNPEVEKCFSAPSSTVSSAPRPTSSASRNATANATTTETRMPTSSFTITTPTGSAAPTSANARPTSRRNGSSSFGAALSLRASVTFALTPILWALPLRLLR
ncbi:MAG: hypothetical protein ABW189_06350 [Rickettsiales bacterium]